jgi:hypothetical protein
MDNTTVEIYPNLDFSMHCESASYSAGELDENLDDTLETNPDLEDLALWLKQIMETVETLSYIKKRLSIECAKKMNTDVTVLAGIGTLQKMPGGSPRKWTEADRLLDVVFARARDDRKYDLETGEYEAEGEAVKRVLSECARFEWRTGKKRTDNFPGTGLHRLGVDPDEYSTREKSPPTVRFVK